MNTEKYLQSLSSECETLKNRVRLLIDDAHWPTDGEWKESVLRSMLKRAAPQSVTVGRGFVVSRDECSSQIDVLIYDNTLPILYKDGDLVFITPSSCRGIIEVKSTVSLHQFRAAARKLATNAQFIRRNSADFHIFVGLFAYDVVPADCGPFLHALRSAADQQEARLIDHVALGSSKFIKYWMFDPNGDRDRFGYDHWHLYNLDRMAPGYFIHNLVVSVSKKPAAKRDDVWFPRESKEVSLEATCPFHGA